MDMFWIAGREERTFPVRTFELGKKQVYTTYPRDTRKNNVVGKEDKADQNTEHMNQTSLDSH